MGRLARIVLLGLVAGGLAGCVSDRDYADCSDRGDDDPTIAACSRIISAENLRRIFGWSGPFTVVAAYRQRGTRYLKKGEFADARDDFAAAIKLYRDDRELFLGRAAALQGLGDHDAAIEDFTTVIRWPARRAGPHRLRKKGGRELRRPTLNLSGVDALGTSRARPLSDWVEIGKWPGCPCLVAFSFGKPVPTLRSSRGAGLFRKLL
jgi:hypothetical protein